MSKGPILTNFVSEMDKFLSEFDRTHPTLSASQQKEVNKYQRIYRLRDSGDTKPPAPNPIWEDF